MSDYYWQNYKKRIETVLPRYISDNILQTPVEYSLLFGGKRFRSSLCYLIVELFNQSLEQADSSAVALECIHAYSLVHDDLPAMDDDDVRRGQPSCHKKFDEATAILTGDVLQTIAFSVISKDISLDAKLKIELIDILSTASIDMVLGQKIDIDNTVHTLEDLKKLHALKTGALLRASMLMGAKIAKVPSVDYDLLYRIGSLIGLAYQVQDDVIELSSTLVTGKSSSDEKNNKTTFISLMGYEEASHYYQRLYQEVLELTSQLSVDSNNLNSLVKTMQNRSF